MHWWKLDAPDRRRFALLAAGSFLYVLPLVLADRYYMDDLGRSVYGATGWAGDGRPLVDLLMQLLSGGQELITDLSPLPLLLGLAALAYALTLYARQALPALRGSTTATLALGLVLAHPFMMANLSYKYDSLTMLLALALCFVLYALPPALGAPRLALAGAAAAALVMGLYQPASGMFLALAGIWLAFWLADGLGSGTPLPSRLPALWPELGRLGGVGAGALVYLLGIAPHFVDQEGWRQQASQAAGGWGLVVSVAKNLRTGAVYLLERLRQAPPLYRLALLVLAVGAVAGALWQFWRSSPARPQRKCLGCLVLVAALPAVFAAAYLPMTVLQNFGVAAQRFLAFCGVLLFLGLLWLRAAPRRRAAAAAVVGCFLFCQTCYLYAYGTTLKSQKAYEVYLVTQIVHDCETLNPDGRYTELSFVGDAPYPRQVERLCGQYPFFRELLVQPNFNNSNWLGGAWVYHYLQQGELKITALTESDEAACTGTAPLAETTLYACYENGGKLLVVFR